MSSILYLPNEILQQIFKELSVSDLIQCSRVCQRWNHAAGGLGDELWKDACMKDYAEVYEDAYRKATLSWFELYKSLNLWAYVSTADVKVYKLPAVVSYEFVLLKDGIIACPHKNSPQDRCDKIIYYDIATQQEHHRVCYDTAFESFTENDNIILVKPLNNYIVITIKSTNKRFSLKKDADMGYLWTLFDNEFYYQTLCKLYRVKLVQQNDDVTLETIEITAGRENIRFFREQVFNIEDIAYTNSGELHIRTPKGWILTVFDNKLRETNFFDVAHIPLNILKCYNLKWNTADISAHLNKEQSEGAKRSPYLTDVKAACFFNKTVIIATHVPNRMLHVYYNPYSRVGDLKICNAIPDKSIDLNAYEVGDVGSLYPAVRQIDVVETINGHNILVLCCGIVHVIELKHNTVKKDTYSKDTYIDIYKQSKKRRTSSHSPKCKMT